MTCYFVFSLTLSFTKRNELEMGYWRVIFTQINFFYRSSVAMRIRKVQFAPVMRPLSKYPCTVVRKDFMFSPGQLELEAVLDKQV